MSTARMAKGALGTFLGLAGATCGLTWLYLSMRSVMEIGGSCASGGPYVVANPCPEGVTFLLLGGLFGGLISLGVFLAFVSRFGGGYATLGAWAWSALFLSLGWNFLDYGLDPPGTDSGVEAGWLVCAALFGLMGGLPLIGLWRASVLRSTFWPTDAELAGAGDAGSRRAKVRELGSTLREAANVRAAAAPPKPAPDANVVDGLERLATLHRQGAIDASEYERAKERLLGGGA